MAIEHPEQLDEPEIETIVISDNFDTLAIEYPEQPDEPETEPIVISDNSDTSTIEQPEEPETEPIVIWPGDTNNDGTVNEIDILPIGSYWLSTGPARQSAFYYWKEQSSLKWPE